YLLSDGLGSVRQTVDETGSVVAYNEFDPYGNSVQNGSSPYGYTGEWWQDEVELLHLRARWYSAGTGTFLSRDAVESEPAYQYVGGNPISRIDPSGNVPNCEEGKCTVDLLSRPAAGVTYAAHYEIIFTDRIGNITGLEGFPSNPNKDIYPPNGDVPWKQRITEDNNFKDVGNPFYWDPIRHPYQTDAGHIIVAIGSRVLERLEELKQDSQIGFTTVAEGEEICEKLECLKSAMEQIEANEIGYKLLGPNSTSAAFTALRKCQLPWHESLLKINEQLPNRFSPGVSLYLLGSLANERASRKSSYDDFLDLTNPYKYYMGY
ncbi:MAG: RHS repeat-associated core domain-containing protein, partial [Deltaproteobacteria bacterium]|nr:RHS repeat-associated core domain-containing protein [Deltaproteobacteria bacterium]